MTAEHRVGAVFQIGIHVIRQCIYHFLLLGAHLIASGPAGQSAAAPCIRCQFGLVAPHFRHRRPAGKDGPLPFLFRRVAATVHLLHIGHGTANALDGQFHGKVIAGFQQDALCLAQTVPHRPISGLTEVTAFGVLDAGPSAEHRDLHIGDGRAGKHAQMLFFFQMGQDESLPVQVKIIGGTQGIKGQAAASGAGLHQ